MEWVESSAKERLLNIRGSSTISVADRTATINLAAGDAVNCTYTNTKRATLEIVKIAEGGDASFNFSTTGSVLPSTFSVSTSKGKGTKTFVNLVPGSVGTVTEEALPAHWDFTSLSCALTVLGANATSVSTNDKTATITTIGAGDTLTCTYTNTKRGEIKIIKGAVGGEGTDIFSFNSTGGLPTPTAGGIFSGSFSGSFDLKPPKGGTDSVTFLDVLPGKYSVTEDISGFGTGLDAWKLAGVVCSATGSGSSGAQDGTNPTANIEIKPGGSVTCTFTNVKASNNITNSSLCPIPNDQFRLHYQPHYVLNASNPGQFYPAGWESEACRTG